jgi:hypothetical protein
MKTTPNPPAKKLRDRLSSTKEGGLNMPGNIIKAAQSRDEIKDCEKYLEKKGLYSYNDSFLYYERDGEIKGACSFAIITNRTYNLFLIEPFYCDDKFISAAMWEECKKISGKLGSYAIVAGTVKEENEKIFTKLGFKVLTRNMNQYIKYSEEKS